MLFICVSIMIMCLEKYYVDGVPSDGSATRSTIDDLREWGVLVAFDDEVSRVCS